MIVLIEMLTYRSTLARSFCPKVYRYEVLQEVAEHRQCGFVMD